jgi:hypothetical protein
VLLWCGVVVCCAVCSTATIKCDTPCEFIKISKKDLDNSMQVWCGVVWCGSLCCAVVGSSRIYSPHPMGCCDDLRVCVRSSENERRAQTQNLISQQILGTAPLAFRLAAFVFDGDGERGLRVALRCVALRWQLFTAYKEDHQTKIAAHFKIKKYPPKTSNPHPLCAVLCCAVLCCAELW